MFHQRAHVVVMTATAVSQTAVRGRCSLTTMVCPIYYSESLLSLVYVAACDNPLRSQALTLCRQITFSILSAIEPSLPIFSFYLLFHYSFFVFRVFFVLRKWVRRKLLQFNLGVIFGHAEATLKESYRPSAIYVLIYTNSPPRGRAENFFTLYFYDGAFTLRFAWL